MNPFAPSAVPSPASALTVEQMGSDYLVARALTVDDARRAGIELAGNAKTITSSFKNRPALVIPYFDPLSGSPMTFDAGGKSRAFLRVRYLGEERVHSFVRSKSSQRYAQPKSSPVFAYFAVGTPIDWCAVLADASIPLVITEGEFKALCACAHGIPTIALGGVDSFRNEGVFLPELERVAWKGRHVIICYDSDLAEKPRVQAAAARLTAELRKRGAGVHLAQLPSASDGSKLGLDDLIAVHGIEFATKVLWQAPEASEFAPIIDLAPHRLLENLEQLDEALAMSGCPVFQRSGAAVYVGAAGEFSDGEEVRRSKDAPVIQELTVPACQQLAMRAATFTRWSGQKKQPVTVDCPADFATHYLSKVDGWRLPPLKGIVQAPTVRPDGTILQAPGYDAASHILYLPRIEFPAIPDTPSRDDAIAACLRLRHVVRGFEFASPEAESVWVAAAMTAVIRKAIRTAPLFAISAPVMGAGKTLAADLVSIIATGHEPAVMSQGRSPDEDRKRLLSVLMRGDAVTQIDNCEVAIEGDALCSILTSPEWQDRVLGQSRMTTVPTNTTFLATGNNLAFRGDMSTRAVLCKLMPKAERPEEREFAWDARAETRANRARLVADVLTIIRAFIVACPEVSHAKPFGRFEEWQGMVQLPLLWVGAPDPCKTRELVERNDVEREVFAQLVHLWLVVFGTAAVHTKSFGELELPRAGAPVQARELWELVCELSGGKGKFNAVAFGKYLRSKEDRMVGGYRLIQDKDKKQKVAIWRLCETQ